MDVFYLAVAFAFFALTWILLRACERLLKRDGRGQP